MTEQQREYIITGDELTKLILATDMPGDWLWLDGKIRFRPCTNEREMWTTDELIAHEKYAADAERTKVLKEFLHKVRKKRTYDDDGICPYDSCVLCEIKNELGEKE